MDREEQFQKSNRRWYQKCFWTCQFCNQTYGSTTAIYNHVKDKHGMDKEAYLDKFGDLGKVVERYNCKICERSMKCDAKTIHTHMKYVHKSSLKDYSKQFHDNEEAEESDDQPYYFDETYQIEYENEEVETHMITPCIDTESPEDMLEADDTLEGEDTTLDADDTLEAEKAFTDRLTEARRKSELLTAKRAEEEAYVMRKYQCGRLKNVIDKMSEIPEGEASILLLPEPPKQVAEEVEDTQKKLMQSLERLIESVQNP